VQAISQSAVLDPQPGRLATGRRQLLAHRREHHPQTRQTLEDIGGARLAGWAWDRPIGHRQNNDLPGCMHTRHPELSAEPPVDFPQSARQSLLSRPR
jgi:hypothetical protein